MGSVEN